MHTWFSHICVGACSCCISALVISIIYAVRITWWIFSEMIRCIRITAMNAIPYCGVCVYITLCFAVIIIRRQTSDLVAMKFRHHCMRITPINQATNCRALCNRAHLVVGTNFRQCAGTHIKCQERCNNWTLHRCHPEENVRERIKNANAMWPST